ncbi:MAG: hypothetical protein AAF368_07895, partial [Planctomycetota bacterium]
MPLLRSDAPGLSRRAMGEHGRRRALTESSAGNSVPMQAALEAFFFALDGAGVPYAILRGGDHLSANHAESRGLDVDLLTVERKLPVFEALLQRSLEEVGGRVWERTRVGHLVQYHLWAPAPAEAAGRRHAFFAIDVHTQETCRGVGFLTAHEAMRRKVRSGHLWHAAPAQAATLSFLGPFLAGDHVDERWARDLRRLLASGTAESKRARWLLRRTFGARRATEIEAALLSHRTEELEEMAPASRRSCLLRSVSRHPLTSLRSGLRQILHSRLRPLWKPRGMFLALLGTDGSGKTTLASRLEEALLPLFRGGEPITGHMRPGLLPQLQSLRTGKPASYSAEEIADPHRAKPSGAVGSWLRASWYTLDFTLGYALKILPKRRRHVLVLFDRWIDDWLVDC